MNHCLRQVLHPDGVQSSSLQRTPIYGPIMHTNLMRASMRTDPAPV